MPARERKKERGREREREKERDLSPRVCKGSFCAEYL
jgi:hypothetical protein